MSVCHMFDHAARCVRGSGRKAEIGLVAAGDDILLAFGDNAESDVQADDYLTLCGITPAPALLIHDIAGDIEAVITDSGSIGGA